MSKGLKQMPDYRPSADDSIPVIECGSEERKAMLYWYGLETQSRICRRVFDKRLEMLPERVRKDYRTGMWFLRRALDKVWISFPGETQGKIHRILSNSRCYMKPNNSIDIEMIMVDRSDFVDLCNMVIQDRCRICVNDAREQKRCKLRRTMMKVCPPSVINHEITHCQFMDIAFAHDDGDFFSVEKESAGL